MEQQGREHLIRVGEVSVAAGWAGLIVGLAAWMMHGSGHADASARAGSPVLSVIGTIEPRLSDSGAAAPEADAPAARPANPGSTFEARFTPSLADHAASSPETSGAIASFSDRFVFDQSAALSDSLRPSMSLDHRLGDANPPVAPALTALPAAPSPNAVAPAPGPRLAGAVPLPRPAPRSVLPEAAPNRPLGQVRLASLSDTPLPAGYAPANSKDATTKEDATTTDSNPLAGDLSHTAIYDIRGRMVYLPSGERLEAHSGLGDYMDDVRAVNLKKLGPTPPNVYELKLRESLFHGVQAIRLVPVAGSKMYGRDGMLAHPFMLGENGESNGCVSFKDYPAFLKAYQRGEVTRMVVVEQLDEPPGGKTAADWFSSTVKKIFGSS
jgi:hypothetical protein